MKINELNEKLKRYFLSQEKDLEHKFNRISILRIIGISMYNFIFVLCLL